jgi:hypothetical protein
MTSVMRQYDYENIINIKSTLEYSLNIDTINIISNLEQILGLDNIPDNIPLKRSDRSFDRKMKNKRGYKMNRGSSQNDLNIDEWEAIRNFKPTEKAELSSFDKNFNEIRMMLNKLSKQNLSTQKSTIVDKITETFKIHDDDSAENQKLGERIFKLLCNNRFLSGVYSELYVDLVGNIDFFGDILDNYIVDLKTSLNNIVYVNPDDDYDGFCDCNVINEERKSNSVFLIHLMKQNMISNQSVIDLIINLQDNLLKYIEEDNKVHQIEETTENIFLLVTEARDVLKEDEMWKTVVEPNIVKFAALKAKDHPSLSSRCVFKHMDMK